MSNALVLTLITSTTALGLGVILVVVCREVIKTSRDTAALCHKMGEASWYALCAYQEAIKSSRTLAESYKAATESAIQGYQRLADEVLNSYGVVSDAHQATAQVAVKSCEDASKVCEQSVAAVNATCQEAIAMTSRTAHEILHASFPNEALNWNWHSANSFMCYYCNQRFPNTEKETIGKYDYCLAHGTVRKQRLMKEECGVR